MFRAQILRSGTRLHRRSRCLLLTAGNQQRGIHYKKDKRQIPLTRADQHSESKYDYTKDSLLQSQFAQIGAFVLVCFVSGKLLGYAIDNYLFEGQGQQATPTPQNSAATPLSKVMVTPLSQPDDFIEETYRNLHELKNEQLERKHCFRKGLVTYIQVGESGEVSPHYFHLKKHAFKSGKRFADYKLTEAARPDLLQKQFQLSPDELCDVDYILVNEDGLKMPMPKSARDIGIAIKFIQNPVQIGTREELYDLLDENRGNSTKYVFALRDSKLGIQTKMLRKAFYENSSMLDDMIIFAELTDASLLPQLQLTRDQDMALV